MSPSTIYYKTFRHTLLTSHEINSLFVLVPSIISWLYVAGCSCVANVFSTLDKREREMSHTDPEKAAFSKKILNSESQFDTLLYYMYFAPSLWTSVVRDFIFFILLACLWSFIVHYVSQITYFVTCNVIKWISLDHTFDVRLHNKSVYFTKEIFYVTRNEYDFLRNIKCS